MPSELDSQICGMHISFAFEHSPCLCLSYFMRQEVKQANVLSCTRQTKANLILVVFKYLYLLPEDGDSIRSLNRFLKKKGRCFQIKTTMDNVQKPSICTNVPTSQHFRSYFPISRLRNCEWEGQIQAAEDVLMPPLTI